MPINYLKKIQLGDYNEEGYRVEPLDQVASVIEGFYVFRRNLESNNDLIFNDGFPVLVFLAKAEQSISVHSAEASFKIRGAWASAGAIKNVYVRYNDHTDSLFIVRFHPGAFYRLFGLTAKYFRSNPVAPFLEIAKSNNFDIERFFESADIDERISFITSFVATSLKDVDTPEVLQKTLDHIHHIKGRSTVRDITDGAGVNYKWLERSFLKNIGLLPKEYIQLHRFIHAYMELHESKEVDLMSVAVANGYYDSNHFLKDFKTYTGKTPIEYLKYQR